MIVTINTIDDKKEKLLAVCNITVDPGDISEKQILQAYSDVLPACFQDAKRNHGTLADVFAKASEAVCAKYPGTMVLSVNDDRKKSNPKCSLNLELSQEFKLFL